MTNNTATAERLAEIARKKQGMARREKRTNIILTLVFSLISLAWIIPIFVVLMNSFKKKSYISLEPFALPTEDSYNALENYTYGIEKVDFFKYFGYSVIITLGSVFLILLCTSMCAYYIARAKSVFASIMYYMFVFSMIVPFQMVMFTLSKTADSLKLNTPWGITIVYLGFGAGLASFMFTNFLKTVPIEIEEAAMIDGCSPLQTFFRVIVPIMKPTYISVAILEVMWVWNDYLLPYLVLDLKRYKTVPIVIQYLQGGYGRVEMGAIMACMILAITPVILIYLVCQKYIVKGVVAGAVKG